MNPHTQTSRTRNKRHGLTLVELLVVLVILAIMTVIAVQSLDYLADQARFEATQRTLGNVQAAVLGAPNQTQPDGSPMLSGFTADIGRPPVADANLQLSELWNQGDLPSFRPVTPAATDTVNSDVTVLAGWRGPYLRLPPFNQQGLAVYDGWGNAFNFLTFGPAKVTTLGDPVLAMQYAGVASDSYTTVLTTQAVTTLTNNPSNLATVITGTVVDTDTTTPAAAPVIVKLYYADPSSYDPKTNGWALTGVFPKEDATGAGLPAPYTFTFTPTLTAKINGNPMPATGNLVLRAYQVVSGVNNKSPVLRLRVPAGGMTQDIRFDLK